MAINPDQKKIIRFLAITIGLYCLWYLVYDLWIYPDGRIDTWLSEQVALAGAAFLKILTIKSHAEAATIFIKNRPVVLIGNPCNGMVLFGVFTGFIIAFPGALKAKLIYIPIGLICIYLVNVLRVAALALNHVFSRGTVDFNHHYTFTFAVYACIFLLWVVWVKKVAKPELA